MQTPSDVQNVVVIGSGPAGWGAAIYLARADLRPTVFAGEKSGGQLMLTTDIENFPGFHEGIAGPLLMDQMRRQAERFGAQVLDANVTQVDFSQRPFRIWSGSREVSARSVLITTGAEAVWLGVKGEEQFIGRGVSSCAVCDAAFFRNKKTIVVGGGDAAMEDALALTKFAESVTLIHRRDTFKASKIMQDRVFSNPKVSVLMNAAVEEVIGDSKVQKVIVRHLDTQATSELIVDGVFVAIGHRPATDLFHGQLQLDEKKYLVTRVALGKPSLELAQAALTQEGFVAYPTMTSVEGVFGAGDVVDFRYRQASTAAGFGVMASLDIERWLEANQ